MWTRVELKEQAKASLHRNYWKIVLVASLLFLLGCGSGGYQIYKMTYHAGTESDTEETGIGVEALTGEESVSEEVNGQGQDGDEMRSMVSVKVDPDTGEMSVEENSGGSGTEKYEVTFLEMAVTGIIAFVLFMVIFLAAFTVIFVVDIFLINPLSVGGCRFMTKSVEDVAQVKEIAYGFDHSYKNVVKVLFHKDLSIFLWTLVFVIPGIVKMYQYYMVPYLLAEHPDLEYKTALQMSRDMMEGNKWKTFVLGLSFILWDFFGVLTLGVGEMLYVQPYRQLTLAALYCKLKNTPVMNLPEQGVYGDSFGGNDRQREGAEDGYGV